MSDDQNVLPFTGRFASAPQSETELIDPTIEPPAVINFAQRRRAKVHGQYGDHLQATPMTGACTSSLAVRR